LIYQYLLPGHVLNLAPATPPLSPRFGEEKKTEVERRLLIYLFPGSVLFVRRNKSEMRVREQTYNQSIRSDSPAFGL